MSPGRPAGGNWRPGWLQREEGPTRKAGPTDPAPWALPPALTVFLIEEFLHPLPQDHLFPESVGIIFIYKRKTRGSEGWHTQGHCPSHLLEQYL